MDQKEHDQFANFFGVLGAVIGFCYGAAVSSGEWGAALIGALICGALGKFVGAILYRVVMVGLIVLGILIRHEIFAAIGRLFE